MVMYSIKLTVVLPRVINQYYGHQHWAAILPEPEKAYYNVKCCTLLCDEH